MNQNRNNNRRRGRGGNRGQGGGNQGNRIDSRARGNAPQLLEKYRKLAHDASLNGDRVQTEYYLQFADHYFRVVADSRPQRDEQRPRYEREAGQDFEDEDEGQQAEAPRSGGQPARRERDDEAQEGQPAVEGERADEGEDNNPFVRESRPRRPRQRTRAASNGAAEEAAATDEETGGFDASALPPAISRNAEEPEQKPRTRRKRSRPAEGGDGEALEAVG